MAITRNDPNRANAEFANNLSAKELSDLRFNKNKDTAIIMAEIQKLYPDSTVKRLGGTNNLNILVQKNDNSASFVVQIGEFKAPTDYAMQSFGNVRPTWLAAFYGRSIIKKPDKYIDANLNQFPTDDIKSVNLIEKCYGSLEGTTKELHANGQYGEAVNLAANIGTQISSMLDTLSKNNVVWLDMKPGNILLREDGQIVIADIKGFYPVDMFLLREGNNGPVIDYAAMNTTETFLSRNFIDSNKFDEMAPGKDTKATWEKEYSYQMAVLLYTVASDQLKINVGKNYYHPDKPQPPEASFNFKHASFQTEEGKRLQSIIERLSHDNPDKRMHHKDAAILLSVISNKQQYDQLNDLLNKAIQKNEAKGKGMGRILGRESKPPSDGYLTKITAKLSSKTSTASATQSSEAQGAENATPTATTAEKKQRRLSKSFSTKNLMSTFAKAGPAPVKPEVAATENQEAKQEKPKVERTKSGRLIWQKLTGKEPDKYTMASNEKSKGQEVEPEAKTERVTSFRPGGRG